MLTQIQEAALSVVSSLCNPLGLATLMILAAKRLLEKMCKENIGWDDVTVSDDLQYLIRQARVPPLRQSQCLAWS